MHVSKAQLLRFLHEHGMVGVAERVREELPDEIDTEASRDRLEDLGIDVEHIRRAASGPGGDAGI